MFCNNTKSLANKMINFANESHLLIWGKTTVKTHTTTAWEPSIHTYIHFKCAIPFWNQGIIDRTDILALMRFMTWVIHLEAELKPLEKENLDVWHLRLPGIWITGSGSQMVTNCALILNKEFRAIRSMYSWSLCTKALCFVQVFVTSSLVDLRRLVNLFPR